MILSEIGDHFIKHPLAVGDSSKPTLLARFSAAGFPEKKNDKIPP
jgi:hypothetical protein